MLVELLLIHGYRCYIRNVMVAKYIFYKVYLFRNVLICSVLASRGPFYGIPLYMDLTADLCSRVPQLSDLICYGQLL